MESGAMDYEVTRDDEVMLPQVGGNAALLTREEAEALARRIFDLVSGPQASAMIVSSVGGGASFARGEVHRLNKAGGRSAYISVNGCSVSTNQLDDTGLTMAITEAEAVAREVGGAERPWHPLGPQEYATPPKLFFESTEAAMAAEARAALVQRALEAIQAAGLIGAGNLGLGATATLRMNTAGLFAYQRGTFGSFSLTARTPDGTGSGWAWSGYEDWSRVQVEAVVARAVELAERSAHPVAIEPGRYTVILEPAAVAAILRFPWSAYQADAGYTAFSNDPRGTNKIGLQMLDRRLGIVADPWDPEHPQSTIGRAGDPVRKVVWFDSGVLRDLEYDRWYAERKNRKPVFAPDGFRLFAEGPTTSLDEMVASTKRGIWVNRLDGVTPMNMRTLLLTGTTRDGTFLIENGKITKPIKNFRFTESPFFVLNKLEAFGEPVRASRNIVCPRLKVRDFNFSSLTDAI